MRVLQIIPTLNKGGAERLVIDICAELNRRNVQVKLVTFRNENAYASYSKNIDWQIIPSFVTPSITSKDTADVDLLMQTIDAYKPEIIHSHLFEAEMVTRHTLRPGVKYVTHCHDNMRQLQKFSVHTIFSKEALTNYHERRIMMKKYLECNNHFIAISKNTFDYFTNLLPAALKSNVHQLHNAIDFKKFESVNHPRNIDTIRIVNTGSFVPKKNQIFLVEILKELIDGGIQGQLTFMGNGPELEKVKERASTLGIAGQVNFAGNVIEVERHLDEANLYVHTAWYEPFGLVLLEAMATGLPVIALDGKGNRDIMKDGVNGYLIEKQDTSLFADKIIEVMSNESLYRSLSRNAVAFAEGFDIGPYVDRLLSLYHSILVNK